MRAFGKKNTGKTVGPKKAAGVNSMPPSGKKTGEGGASRAASAWRAVGEAAMSTKHLVSERIKRMSPNTSAEELLFPGNRPDKRRGRSLENARSNGNDAPRVRSASPNRLNCNKCSVSLEAQVKYFCTECKHVYCDKCSSKQQLLPIADERHKPKKQQNKLDICLECSVGGPAEPFLQSPHPVVADVVRFSHPPRRAYSGASRPPPKPCASMNFEFIDLDEIVIDENVSPENIKFGNVGRRESCDHMSLEDLLAGIDEIVSPSKYQSSAAIHHICSIDDTSTHSDDVSAGSRVIRRNPEDTFVMFSPSDDQKGDAYYYMLHAAMHDLLLLTTQIMKIY